MVAFAAIGACEWDATEVVVSLGSDVPATRTMVVEATVFGGTALNGDGGMLSFVPGPRGTDGFIEEALGSRPALPRIRARLRSSCRPPCCPTRPAHLPSAFAALRASWRLRLTWPAHWHFSCASRVEPDADGCTSVTPSQCTVSVLCEEQGLTCGDNGDCVSQTQALGTYDGGMASFPFDGNASGLDASGDIQSADAHADAVACPAGQQICSGACVDVATDMHNCGQCGSTCSTSCQAGACVACPTGQSYCGGACVDLSSSLQNCGQCGSACTTSCQSANCVSVPVGRFFLQRRVRQSAHGHPQLRRVRKRVCHGLSKRCVRYVRSEPGVLRRRLRRPHFEPARLRPLWQRLRVLVPIRELRLLLDRPDPVRRLVRQHRVRHARLRKLRTRVHHGLPIGHLRHLPGRADVLQWHVCQSQYRHAELRTMRHDVCDRLSVWQLRHVPGGSNLLQRHVRESLFEPARLRALRQRLQHGLPIRHVCYVLRRAVCILQWRLHRYHIEQSELRIVWTDVRDLVSERELPDRQPNCLQRRR